jgi:acyl-CoA synthetase (AMP-forming)/AMP-acid ligase II
MNAFDYFFENTSQLGKLFLEGKESISFSDLYHSSLNLADQIRAEVGERQNIILISPNNLFFIKVYLAIIKSGNICIPLDPTIEEENFRFIYSLTNPALVFCSRELIRKLAGNSVKTYTQDTLLPNIPVPGTLPPVKPIPEEECCEIIFTSGSTGIPKGVMISHKNLIANTKSILEYLNLTSGDKMLVVLPFYYCYGLSLLHTHLRIGGSIVFNNSFIFLGRVILDLAEYKCTGFAGVPSHFQILLRMSESFLKTEFPHLRYVTQAGGKLSPVFVDEFRENFPGVLFYIMYGQTEATARLSYLSPDKYEQKKGSIGKGIPGVELRVVNEQLVEITPGQTGEIIARGDNIMLGYYMDKETTANVIRDGWLYTGDLGTIDEDGFIFLSARKKEILKVGGKRISPKEIETIILQIHEVIDCTVEGIEDELQGEALKATVIVKKGCLDVVTPEMLREHCAKNLALFKVPHLFEIKDQVFISPTGKKLKK